MTKVSETCFIGRTGEVRAGAGVPSHNIPHLAEFELPPTQPR